MHIQAAKSKGKKLRTVVLLPLVSEAVAKQIAGRSKGWLFPIYRELEEKLPKLRLIKNHISMKVFKDLLLVPFSRALLLPVRS